MDRRFHGYINLSVWGIVLSVPEERIASHFLNWGDLLYKYGIPVLGASAFPVLHVDSQHDINFLAKLRHRVCSKSSRLGAS